MSKKDSAVIELRGDVPLPPLSFSLLSLPPSQVVALQQVELQNLKNLGYQLKNLYIIHGRSDMCSKLWTKDGFFQQNISI